MIRKHYRIVEQKHYSKPPEYNVEETIDGIWVASIFRSFKTPMLAEKWIEDRRKIEEFYNQNPPKVVKEL